MRSQQLFINNKLVELTDDSPIALVLQINNIAEIRDQQGSTSKQFKIPMTIGNKKILGFPNEMPFTTNLPYTRYIAKYIVDGVEVVPYGVGELDRVDQDYAYMVVVSGNSDFFDLLDIKMTDMATQFAEFDHEWTLANVVASQTKTEGWKYPIINYGNMTGAIDEIVNVKYLRPAFFLHSAISLFQDYTGYTIEGNILTDPFYKRILIPFASDEFKHGKDFAEVLETKLSKAGTSGQELDGKDTGPFVIPFPYTHSDSSGSWNGSKYTAQMPMKVKATFEYDLGMYDPYSGGSVPSVTIAYRVNGVVSSVYFNYHVPTAEYTIFQDRYILESEIILEEGDTLDVVAILAPSPNTPPRIMACIGTLLSYNATFQTIQWSTTVNTITINPVETEVVYNSTVQCEQIMPDVPQKEFIKDMFQKFGIFVQTDNYRRVVTLYQFKEIVAKIPIAVDWSSKIKNQGKQTEFQLGDYGKINRMYYREDDRVTRGLGYSDILIDNENLRPLNELFLSIYAACLDFIFHGNIAIPLIKKIEDGAEINVETGLYDFTVHTEPRLLIDYIVTGVDVDLTDGDTTTNVTTISAPYFDSLDDSLKWDYLKEQNYTELIKVLTQTKKIVRYVKLEVLDISNLDFSVPVFIKEDGHYFYINRIDGWINGVITKVELIRL